MRQDIGQRAREGASVAGKKAAAAMLAADAYVRAALAEA